MIFKIPKDIKFSFFYRKFNILSLLLVVMSVLILVFKGLNLGVDFKGGTLIELRTENTQISISNNNMDYLKPIEQFCIKYNITYKYYTQITLWNV